MKTEQILSYWHDIEFFTPFLPTEDKNSTKIRSKNQFEQSLPWYKKSNLPNKNYIYDIFLGIVDSEQMIDKIKKILNSRDTPIEKNNLRSCTSSFQIDSHGNFIDGSFCFATYAWSMAKIIANKTLDIQFLKSEINELTNKANEHISEIMSFKKENEPLNSNDIVKIFDISSAILNIESDDVKFYVIINRKYISEIVSEDKKNNEDEENIKIESNMLSSFFIDDLEFAKKNIDKLSSKTLNYIHSLEYNYVKRIEIDTDIQKMKNTLHESNYPMGKWPSKYSPSLMQQIAINLAIKEDIDQDIFSINGPPGTGKTTLLKEIIASYVVDRAFLFSTCGRPDEFFTKGEFTDKSRYIDEYYIPNNNLIKYGIIIASNNNGAVENISKELPKSEDVISEKCNTDLFDIEKNNEIYFSYVSDILSAEQYKSWGLISARLGKGDNISEFKKAIWFDDKNSLRILYKQGYRPDFDEAKQVFLAKYNEVKACINEITEDKKIFDKISNSFNILNEQTKKFYSNFNEMEKIRIELNRRESEKRELENNKLAIEKSIEQLYELDKSYQSNIDVIWNRLNFFQKHFPFLFKKNVLILQINEIKKLKDDLIINISNNLLEKDNENKKIHDKEVSVNDLKNNFNVWTKKAEKSEKDLEECRKKYDNLLLQQEALKEKYRNNFSDDVFWNNIQKNKNSQVSCPFTTKKYDTLREELFFYALNLHKAFILNSNSVRKNIQNLINAWGNKISYIDKRKSYAHLLNTLMLVVPVISTTLASVANFLDGIEENELGTLIIDEAGQATPQSALGAIMRCQKAIVVGDPLQIEPIVTIPKEINQKIAQKYNIDSNYIMKDNSVQVFADNINKYGGNRKVDGQNFWLGCPLVVHRRCIEPMFTISNEIAYNKKMFNETPLPSGNIKFSLSKSCWINISGREVNKQNHFVEEQGTEAINLIIEAFKVYNDEIPNLFVISPFTTVINTLKPLLMRALKNTALKQDVGKIEYWIKNCCGTIHTFQGKEANEVIIILGCDTQTGVSAAQWVGQKQNILNVAVSRAKYRCVIIGDKNLWKNVNYVSTAMRYLSE